MIRFTTTMIRFAYAFHIKYVLTLIDAISTYLQKKCGHMESPIITNGI